MKTNFEFCTGCGLCHSAYHVHFQKDGDGFAKPQNTNDIFSKKEMKRICPFGENGVSKYSGGVWGKYLQVVRGYATDEIVRYKASSGGVITAILCYLLRNKLVDGVVLTKADSKIPYHCETFCARTEEDIVSACGSRYAQSSPLMEILDLVKPGEKYAVVGKPCDISTLRRYMEINTTLRSQIIYMVSFFCAGMPSDRANRKLLHELKCKDCAELRYRGNGWPGYTTAIDCKGVSHEMEYQRSWMEILGRDIRKCCKFCFDGIGEYADISCGDLWNLTKNKKPDFSESKGYNIVFARTMVGKELLAQVIKNGDIEAQDWEMNIDNLRYCQPNHYIKRTTILSKVIALKLLFKESPKYKVFRMIAYAKESDMKTQWGSFKGTIKRSIEKRL